MYCLPFISKDSKIQLYKIKISYLNPDIINNFDDLNVFSIFLSFVVIIANIFGHGNNNKLVLLADNPLYVKGLFSWLLSHQQSKIKIENIALRAYVKIEYITEFLQKPGI